MLARCSHFVALGLLLVFLGLPGPLLLEFLLELLQMGLTLLGCQDRNLLGGLREILVAATENQPPFRIDRDLRDLTCLLVAW